MDMSRELMGPPAKSSDRADEIRQVAARLFETTGYSSTKVTDIAKAAGVLPGSLYHHFASKEDVALEIVSHFAREASELAASLSARLDAPGAGSARSHLTLTAESIADFSERNRAALRLTAYAAPTTAIERFRRARASAVASFAPLWERLVEDISPADGKADDDVALLRFALGHLSLHAALNTAQAAPPRSVISLNVEMLLDGIARDTPADDLLDRSDAMAAAREAIARWGPDEQQNEPNSLEHIVAAARTEFARRGFDATTVRDIAEAAQVRMGTLYRRVSSKDEVLAEILGTYDAHMEAAVRSVLTAGNSPVESLDALAYVMVMAKRRFRHETEIVKLANPWTTPTSGALKSYLESTAARLKLLEAALTRAMADGAVRTLAAPAQIAPQIRYITWVPFGDSAQSNPAQAHRFLRNSLLRGFLNSH